MKSVRTAPPGLWLAVGAVLVRLPAVAADDSSLEEIVVTGTRIARTDFSSASPIASVPAVAFTRRASTTVETTLNEMPQLVPSHTSTSNEFGFGEATANLRGLGSPRTLVLIDGRRLIAARDDGVSDLNVIPPTLIESVEIVTGGASAVYGSDAIAGVINFKLKDDFQGLAVDGSWGQTDYGDGEEYEVSVTAGTDIADGRGSVTGSIGYSNRAQINGSERDFSRVLLEFVGAGIGTTGPDDAYVLAGGSFNTEEGTAKFIPASDAAFRGLFASYGYDPDEVPYPFFGDFGINDDGSLFTMGNFEPGSVVNFRGDPALLVSDARYGYNFAPWQALQMPLERVSGFGSGRFQITENAEAYASGLYADYTVDTQAAPPVLSEVFAPVTNPYIPPDLALLLASREGAEAEAPVDIGKRMSSLGPREQENHTRMYQLVGGLRGILAGDWTYDFYAQFAAVDQTRRRDGEVRRSLAFELLHAPDGGISICGGFDPFGPGSIQQGCADYVRADVEDEVESRETVVEATVTGSPIELPAGPLRVVLGAAYRDHEFSYDGDEILAVTLPDGGPDVPGFARFDFGADDQNIDLYMEAGLPLLAGRAAAQSLEAVVGYRRSEYASAGGIDAWKAELLYRPVASLRLRGSYQRAARAPSINELYDPALPDFAFFDEDGEPCSAGSPQRSGADAAMVEQLCVAQGMPPALLPTYFNDIIPIESGGNPDLDAERATTYTAGLVFQPSSGDGWLDGLQVSLDWYSIEIDDAIEFVSADEAVLKCFDAAFNPGYRSDSSWCAQFSRDTGTGDIVDARGQPRNFASLRTSGIDLNLDWSIAAGPGRLHTGAFVSWIDSFETKVSELAPAEEAAGTVGSFAGSYPEWKWSVRLGYAIGAFDGGVTWNYVDSMEDGSRFPFGDLPENDVTVPHVDYFNLDFAYRFEGGALDGLEIRAGIENLTDEDPPVFPSGTYYNTDPSQYDVLGRRYFTGLHYSF